MVRAAHAEELGGSGEVAGGAIPGGPAGYGRAHGGGEEAAGVLRKEGLGELLIFI